MLSNGKKNAAKFFGFTLTECLFREDDEIWRDTLWHIEGGKLPSNWMGGYWTTIMKKES